VKEETGLDLPAGAYEDWRHVNRYTIYPHWRHRYAAGVTHNTEHVFGLAVVAPFAAVLAPREHTRFQWRPWREAADLCFSWTNAQAIRLLADRAARPH
jgi:dATP pyrophosphohydrolase